MAYGRPDNQRYLKVYMPSREDRKRWEAIAAKKGYKTMTKFIYDHVQLALRNEGSITGAALKTLQNHIRELQTGVGELKRGEEEMKRRDRMREAYVEQLEEELRGYRRRSVAPFLHKRPVRTYEARLVALLQERGELKSEEIFASLGLDPKGDGETIRGLREQLVALSGWGLVKLVPDGWRWTAWPKQ